MAKGDMGGPNPRQAGSSGQMRPNFQQTAQNNPGSMNRVMMGQGMYQTPQPQMQQNKSRLEKADPSYMAGQMGRYNPMGGSPSDANRQVSGGQDMFTQIRNNQQHQGSNPRSMEGFMNQWIPPSMTGGGAPISFRDLMGGMGGFNPQPQQPGLGMDTKGGEPMPQLPPYGGGGIWNPNFKMGGWRF